MRRRLPLYCEVGPTILLTTAGEEITSPQERSCRLYSCSVFVCVIRCAFYNSRVSICVLSAPLLVRYSARCCCVLFLVCSGVSESEREVARSS